MFDLDLLKSKLDIVEIINAVLPLKKYGHSYKGCCPFHQEKTPSFNVNPEKQLYHCFGCHKGGDVFEFIMELKGISFKQTIKEFALFGLNIEGYDNE
jgi:DNA primase